MRFWKAIGVVTALAVLAAGVYFVSALLCEDEEDEEFDFATS